MTHNSVTTNNQRQFQLNFQNLIQHPLYWLYTIKVNELRAEKIKIKKSIQTQDYKWWKKLIWLEKY